MADEQTKNDSTTTEDADIPKGIYHVLLFAFEGEKSADEIVKQLRSSQKEAKYDVLEWAIVRRNAEGKIKVKQPGHGDWGAGIGGGTGAALALIGGPLGIAAATVVGALAGGAIGHFVGRNFDQDELKKAAAALPPNSSGFVALVQDTGAEALLKDMKGVTANVVTLTAGSELSGALLHAAAADIEVEEDASGGDTGAPKSADADASDDSSATTGGPAPSNAPPVEG